jgi:hypothetical protein
MTSGLTILSWTRSSLTSNQARPPQPAAPWAARAAFDLLEAKEAAAGPGVPRPRSHLWGRRAGVGVWAAGSPVWNRFEKRPLYLCTYASPDGSHSPPVGQSADPGLPTGLDRPMYRVGRRKETSGHLPRMVPVGLCSKGTGIFPCLPKARQSSTRPSAGLPVG